MYRYLDKNVKKDTTMILDEDDIESVTEVWLYFYQISI
jgi:hypothetical protein